MITQALPQIAAEVSAPLARTGEIVIVGGNTGKQKRKGKTLLSKNRFCALLVNFYTEARFSIIAGTSSAL